MFFPYLAALDSIEPFFFLTEFVFSSLMSPTQCNSQTKQSKCSSDEEGGKENPKNIFLYIIVTVTDTLVINGAIAPQQTFVGMYLHFSTFPLLSVCTALFLHVVPLPSFSFLFHRLK